MKSVKFKSGWGMFNAGEVAGVPEHVADQLIKKKMAVAYDPAKHEPDSEPVENENRVTVRALKGFDKYNTGEVFGVAESQLERLVEGGWVKEEPAELKTEDKSLSAPPVNKMVSAPNKAK